MKMRKKLKSELPDDIISYIFSKLALKDLVKTSALSTRWIHEWGLRMDLNFDLHTMFDYNTIQDLPKSLPLFQRFHFQSEFATRLDQFMLHHQGAMIRSIRINFPLGNEQSDVIDRLISKAIAKGAKRIELLFSSETNDTTDFILQSNDTTDHIVQIEPYKFPLALLSATTDSLTYLHLQNCLLVAPMDLSRLKNVTTIVLDGLAQNLSDHILPQMFSECLQLEDATFKNCKVTRCIKITSPKLRSLNIINCGYRDYFPRGMAIDALNLSSFEYSGHTSMIFVTAPRLLKVFWNGAVREKTPHPFCAIGRLPHIENLALIINPSQIEKITKVLVQLQNLRQLELFIEGPYEPNMDYFWILDITTIIQHLRKLSLTIRNLDIEHSHTVGFQRQKRGYTRFSHDNLKYVEFHGCVCCMNVIEIASLLLRNTNLLQKMTFSSHDKFYKGAGRWTSDSHGCCWFKHNVIQEMLKDDINEQCQLIIL